ncbi:MAG: oxidoreductase [Anaerolineales bacterium]|nr:MAG: oxidoreductase [Anaerolineales bacterium]
MVKEIPVIWLQAAGCTGCSVSLLNMQHPGIKNLLVDEIIPGIHVNLRFHATVMGGSGDVALSYLDDTVELQKGGYVLVVEGAIPTRDGGHYGTVGERDDMPVTMADRVSVAAEDALAVLAVGTCASFGGISAAAPNPSNAMSVGAFLKSCGIEKPLINIPGCPPHPDWIVGTIANVLLNGLPTADDIDDLGRPLTFYGKLIHENCPLRAAFDEGRFARKFGEEGCLYELGCKGSVTYADCPTRRWNSATNWVIGAGAPCNGCTQPEFPDLLAPLYEKIGQLDNSPAGRAEEVTRG